jgi:hypothetical protein
MHRDNFTYVRVHSVEVFVQVCFAFLYELCSSARDCRQQTIYVGKYISYRKRIQFTRNIKKLNFYNWLLSLQK